MKMSALKNVARFATKTETVPACLYNPVLSAQSKKKNQRFTVLVGVASVFAGVVLSEQPSIDGSVTGSEVRKIASFVSYETTRRTVKEVMKYKEERKKLEEEEEKKKKLEEEEEKKKKLEEEEKKKKN